jgi:CO/xanthine dehydrogenase Mo-binding subunit
MILLRCTSPELALLGTPAKRVDTPAKVNGSAIYGIDVRLPGMKIATLVQSPVFGGRLKNLDDRAAKAVKGVRQIVRLEDAVAVVADHWGRRKKGSPRSRSNGTTIPMPSSPQRTSHASSNRRRLARV